MQILESSVSLLALLSLSVLLIPTGGEKIDTSLYVYELQGDAKNVIYLKGGFENISRGNEIAEGILQKTGLCMELDQTQITSGLTEGAPSSPSSIPSLKPLKVLSNGTVIEIKDANLTGFTQDSFHFGRCLNAYN